MENTDHISADLPSLETLETLDAIRHNHAQRLLDMAEALLQGFEAIDIPKDAAGLDRAGKALLTLNKVMDTLHQNARALVYKAEVEAARHEAEGKPAPDPSRKSEVMSIYRAAQNLRLEALAFRRAANGSDEARGASPGPSPRHYSP